MFASYEGLVQQPLVEFVCVSASWASSRYVSFIASVRDFLCPSSVLLCSPFRVSQVCWSLSQRLVLSDTRELRQLVLLLGFLENSLVAHELADL